MSLLDAIEQLRALGVARVEIGDDGVRVAMAEDTDEDLACAFLFAQERRENFWPSEG